jgi:hypothetical protein
MTKETANGMKTYSILNETVFNPNRKRLYKCRFRYEGKTEILQVEARDWDHAMIIINGNFPNHSNLKMINWRLS